MNSEEICGRSACELVSLVKNNELSTLEIAKSYSKRIGSREKEIHAFEFYDEELYIRNSILAAERIKKSNYEGKMLGIPVGVKDIFNTKEMPTCMGSPIWKDFTPGNNARVVDHFLFEGGVIVGKTVTAEFAVHHPGKTLNPHDPRRIPGTSSSGSAAAVATGMALVALGTQTAGSTIRPASYCGVYGFKPSFGVIPRTGILKTLDTLDHVCMFARFVDDLKLFFGVLRVKGRNHPYIYKTLDSYESSSDRPLKIAFIKTDTWKYAHDYARDDIVKFAEELGKMKGIAVEEFDTLPCLDNLHYYHSVIYEKALSYYFQDEYQNHREELSEVFRQMVERGQKTTIDTYKEILKKQEICIHEMDNFFEDFDLILSLPTTGEAPLVSAPHEPPDPTLMWTYSHIPSVTMPLFKGPNDMPFGAQLSAGRYSDLMLLDFASRLESEGFTPLSKTLV